MSDTIKLASQLPKVLQSLVDSDLSLVEQAAVFQIAASTCTQAHLMAELITATKTYRGKS